MYSCVNGGEAGRETPWSPSVLVILCSCHVVFLSCCVLVMLCSCCGLPVLALCRGPTQTSCIAVIDPPTGKVVAWMDANSLR